MKLRSSLILSSLMLFGGVNVAHAETELRGEEYCYPAKDVPKLVNKLNEIDVSRRDVVDVSLQSKFLIKDGGGWPERFFIRTQTDEIDLLIEKPSGATPTFIKTAINHSGGEICVIDKARADRPENDEGLYFEMGLSPLFHNSSGRHNLAELQEGTEDAKKFYKKMVPAAISMFVPNINYLAVRYEDRRQTSQVFAIVNGEEVNLITEMYKDMHVFSFESLKDLGASAVLIKDGEYKLQPTVSVKTMKRFGWGEDTDETSAEN